MQQIVALFDAVYLTISIPVLIRNSKKKKKEEGKEKNPRVHYPKRAIKFPSAKARLPPCLPQLQPYPKFSKVHRVNPICIT
jgi:hypothetical protein